ncbi:MAG: hypothetical protein ACR2IP_01590 [Solirubrobacteraceae bacterium]
MPPLDSRDDRRGDADSLERGGRSLLHVRSMRGAARDIDSGGQVAALFDGVPVPPGRAGGMESWRRGRSES